MRKLINIMLLFCAPLMAQNTYYVSTTGSDVTGDGSLGNPWGTWGKGMNSCSAGDTLYLRGGVYYTTSTQRIDSSGTKQNPIHIFGYPDDWAAGDTAILDARSHCDGYSGFNSAIYIYYAEHIHFKNFKVRNVFMCGENLNGSIHSAASSNLTFENITLQQIGQKAFWINSGTWSTDYGHANNGPFPYDSTYFINCDVFNVCDTFPSVPSENGNGGDAFKTVNYQSTYYSWEGCRAWNYSDDAFDPSGAGYKIFNNCWAMSSNKYGSFSATEGNGFKIVAPNILYYDPSLLSDTILAEVTNCIAIFSVGSGFTNNLYSSLGYPNNNGLIYNNTSYKNLIGFVDSRPLDDPIVDSICTTIYRNNLAYGNTQTNEVLQPANIEINAFEYTESNNTWDYTGGNEFRSSFVMTDSVTLSDAMFLYDSTQMVAYFTAPRQADGSLPAIHPTTLAPTSDLIDAGTQIPTSDGANFTFTFDGLSPDIGAGDVVKVLSSTPASPVATSRKRPAGTATKVYGGGDVIYEF